MLFSAETPVEPRAKEEGIRLRLSNRLARFSVSRASVLFSCLGFDLVASSYV